MTPYEQARNLYQREPCARTFGEDLNLHLRFGYVFSTPRCFLMGRAVDHMAPGELIVNPAFNDFAVKDCWHVYLYVGKLRDIFKFTPYVLPWYSFERENKLRVYTRSRFESVSHRLGL